MPFKLPTRSFVNKKPAILDKMPKLPKMPSLDKAKSLIPKSKLQRPPRRRLGRRDATTQ